MEQRYTVGSVAGENPSTDCGEVRPESRNAVQADGWCDRSATGWMMPKRTPRFSIAPAGKPKTVNLVGAYGNEWRKLRNRRLNAEPLCRHCRAKGLVTPAAEVDHITPRLLGGPDEWDNTQSLCKACHVVKTRDDMQRIRRGC